MCIRDRVHTISSDCQGYGMSFADEALSLIHISSVVERTKIQRMDGEVKYIDDNGEWRCV